MESWGFEYKTVIAWVKSQIGMGNYFRVSSELIMFGVRGDLPIEDQHLPAWFKRPRGKHSAKPEFSYEMVIKASPGPYLEMFARCDADSQLPGLCRCSRCRLGWETWGNQS
jgi:N6-adenosine-specific RNA methylase IME4